MSENTNNQVESETTTNQEINVSEPNITDSDYQAILAGVPAEIAGGTISRTTAAQVLASVNGNVEQAIQALRNGAFADRFADFRQVDENGNAPDYEHNPLFTTLANDAVNDALPTLPNARVLEQSIYTNLDDGVYTTFINKVFSAPKYVSAGAGEDYVLEGCPEVIEMNSNNLIPTTLKNIDSYSRVDTITLPDTIWQAYVTIQAFKYVKYFLSGKVDEYIKVATENLAKAMFKCQFYDCIQLLKTAFQTQYALTPSTSVYSPTSAYLVTSKDGFIDAVNQLQTFTENMLEDNTIFSYVQGTGIQFISTKADDLVYICDKETRNKFREHAISGDSITKAILDKLVVCPSKAYNPKKDNGTGQPKGGIESVDIFVDSLGNKVSGAVLVVDKKWLVRMFNLALSNAANYPFGLTEAISHFARYQQGIVKWCPIALITSPEGKGLNSDFSVPVTIPEAE